MVTTPGRDGPAEDGYDPMRQFAELAGDVRDPYPMFAGIRADSPVMEVHFGPEPGDTTRLDRKAPRMTSLFTVMNHELAQRVLTDDERFSSAGHASFMGQVLGRSILEMDGPEHVRHRALVAKAFRARVLEGWSDTIIGPTVSELIDAFADDGHADLIPQLTFPFPVRVIARVLGLPESDWPRFLRLSTELIGVMRNWDRAVAASQELRGYFADIIADRRRHAREDLVSQLIEAEVDGRRLERRGDLSVPAAAPARGGGDDLSVVEQPAVRPAVASGSVGGGPGRPGLVPQAIEEALRWETPLLTVARTATEDVELGGVRVPAGGFVAVSLGAANRDPARYPEPDAFDVFRGDKQHMSFGDGAHKCLGMHLARVEMRVLLDAVLDRLPGLRLDPGGNDTHIHGLLFRSPPNLPVRFDPA